MARKKKETPRKKTPPLLLYFTFIFTLVPLLVSSIVLAVEWDFECDGMREFLLVYTILFGLQTVFHVYIYRRVRFIPSQSDPCRNAMRLIVRNRAMWVFSFITFFALVWNLVALAEVPARTGPCSIVKEAYAGWLDACVVFMWINLIGIFLLYWTQALCECELAGHPDAGDGEGEGDESTGDEQQGGGRGAARRRGSERSSRRRGSAAAVAPDEEEWERHARVEAERAAFASRSVDEPPPVPSKQRASAVDEDADAEWERIQQSGA
jgi:hypothetical protein